MAVVHVAGMPQHFEGNVNSAPTGDLEDLLSCVVGNGIDNVSGAEPLGLSEFLTLDIDGDDQIGTHGPSERWCSNPLPGPDHHHKLPVTKVSAVMGSTIGRHHVTPQNGRINRVTVIREGRPAVAGITQYCVKAPTEYIATGSPSGS